MASYSNYGGRKGQTKRAFGGNGKSRRPNQSRGVNIPRIRQAAQLILKATGGGGRPSGGRFNRGNGNGGGSYGDGMGTGQRGGIRF